LKHFEPKKQKENNNNKNETKKRYIKYTPFQLPTIKNIPEDKFLEDI